LPGNPATAEEALLQRVRQAGLRLTLQRRAICAVLARNQEAFLTVGEIVAEVEEIAGPIDPSTCHRTLRQLADIGAVHHIHLGSQPAKWHLTLEHNHQHLACETCGSVTLVPAGEFQEIFDMLQKECDFYISPHHFAILGQCGRCQRTRAQPDHLA